MRLRRRHALLIALALLLLPLLVAGIWLWRVDPNQFRPEIERQAYESLGVPLRITGQLSWQLWPLFSLHGGAGQVNESPTIDRPLMTWRGIALRARWRELRQNHFAIDQIDIEGLSLHLDRDPTGAGNWDPVLESLRVAASRGESNNAHISGLRLHDGVVQFRDERARRSFQLERIELQLGFDFNVAHRQWAIDGIVLSARALGQPLQLSVSRVVWQGENNSMMVEPVQFRWGDGRLQLTVASSLTLSPLQGAGKWQMQSDSLRRLLVAGGVAVPTMRDSSALQKFAAASSWRLGDSALAFNDLELRLDDTSVRGMIRLRFGAMPRYDLDLNADSLDLDRYQPPQSNDKSSNATAMPFSIGVFRAWPVNGKIQFQSLTTAGTVARNATIEFTSR
jgi:AsmA protein